jgi:hypothetical protein
MVFVHVPTKTVVVKFSTWRTALDPIADRWTFDASFAIAEALG